MHPRTSTFSALIFLSLLAASGLVVAQVNVTVVCNTSWEWTYNTQGQNACTVFAYLQVVCSGGWYSIGPLPSGYFYVGPLSGEETSCMCNPVAYNLLSACGACQGASWTTWSKYSANCLTTLALAYPNPIPPGTLLPQWALLDTPVADNWNDTTASVFAANHLPDIQPGSLIGTSAFGVVGPTFTTSQSGASTTFTSTTATTTDTTFTSATLAVASASFPSNSPSPSFGGRSKTSALAGGVAGGFVALAVIGLLIYFLRKKRTRAQAPPSAFVVGGATSSQSASDIMTELRPPMRIYDPNDSSTFPGSLSPTPEGSLNGSTTSTGQTTGVRGYHGLPMV